MFQSMLADQHRRSFQMNPFMLDAHDDGPPRILPVQGQSQRSMFKDVQDQGTYLMTIIADFLHGRPVIMYFIQIVPAHLVYTDCEDTFKMRIYAFANQLAEQQFIDKKSGGMGKIKNQRMT